MSRDIITDQALMMTAFHQTITSLNAEQTTLYLNMVVEEVGELLTAANPSDAATIALLVQLLHFVARYSPEADLKLVFDGIMDVIVVTINVGHSLALPLHEGWDEVHRSNMAKVDPITGKVIKNDAGKVQKPEGWTPPDLATILRQAEEQPKPLVPHVVISPATALTPTPAAVVGRVSLSDRYLNLALQHLGASITTIGNLRQNAVPAGDGYVDVSLGLSRVASALAGKNWEPPVGVKEREELAELQTQLAEVAKFANNVPAAHRGLQPRPEFTEGYNLALQDLQHLLGRRRRGNVGS